MIRVPDGSLRILVHGAQRVRLTEWVQSEPYLVARVEELAGVVRESAELTALARNVQGTFSELVEIVPYLPEELQLAVANVDEPSALSYLIAGALRLSTPERQALLEEPDVERRLRTLAEILAREADIAAIGSRIQSQVQSEMDKGQREWFLRQQMKAIQEELGEEDPAQAEVTELREQIEAAELPEDARTRGAGALAAREHPAGGRRARDHPVLPGVARRRCRGRSSTEDNLDLAHAREVLDADHYDIEKVKDRILEFLAVRKLKPDAPRLDPLLRRAARRRQDLARAARSPARWGASSCASASAACATRRRSAGTGAPTSARCPGRSCARCATRAPTTPCS